jgi:hypothetical protein
MMRLPGGENSIEPSAPWPQLPGAMVLLITMRFASREKAILWQ